jgi:glycosyltransferase involved in cell wall biosynthesis
VVTHPSYGSPASFVRIQGIAKALASLNVHSSILSPFQEEQDIVSDVDFMLLPSNAFYSKILSAVYGGTRKLASSPYASFLFYSNVFIETMVKNIQGSLMKFFSNRDNKCDIIHAVQPIAGLACTSVSRKLNVPLIVDLHNCWPEEVASQNLCNRGDEIFERLRSVEQSIIDDADCITVVTDALKDYILKNYNACRKNVIVVPCGATQNSTLPPVNREKKVVYAGTLNFREHVDLFVKSIPLVKAKAKFSISDYGDKSREIRKMVKEIDDPRINLVWYRKRIDVIRLLNSSQLGIVTSHDDITRQLGPPLKLYDYLSCGLPVIANDVGGWTEVIKKEQVGLLTADDPMDFATAIDRVLNDESEWHAMHNNAVKLISQRYNWGIISKDSLVPLYNKL